MAPKGIAAPRALLLVLLTLVVGAVHWWLLRDLGRSATATPAPTPSTPVFETRSIAPPTPPSPAPSAVVASPKPKPKPAPPKPKPKPVPPPPPAPIPEAIEPIAEVAVPAEAPALPPPSDMSAQDSSTAASEETATPAPPPAADASTDGVALATETTSPTPPPSPPDEAGEADGAAENVTTLAAPTGILLHTAPGQAEQTDLPYQAPPAQLLQFKVQGQAKGFEYGASAQLLWQPQGNTYQASQEVSAFLLGTRAQSSRGHITDSGLQPERFEDRARKKLRAAMLDWASGMARFEPEAPSAPIAAGTQDRLSVFLQLAGMVAAAPQHYPTGATISVPTASTRGVQTWVFQVHDTPRLDLPAGVLETVRLERLERLPQGGRDQKAELWLAPALGYLPVRIRLSESNGDYADLRLQSHSAP